MTDLMLAFVVLLVFVYFTRPTNADLNRAYWAGRADEKAGRKFKPHSFHYFGDQKERRCNFCDQLESRADPVCPVQGD